MALRGGGDAGPWNECSRDECVDGFRCGEYISVNENNSCVRR